MHLLFWFVFGGKASTPPPRVLLNDVKKRLPFMLLCNFVRTCVFGHIKFCDTTVRDETRTVGEGINQ